MEAGYQVNALFTDFEKAFDRVPHDILIMKIAKLGIHSNLLHWIWSYLRGRKQFVKMGSAKSRLFDATSGVPQGSHIGPLLFLVFINDIVSVLQPVGYLLFADDLKIYSRIRGLEDASLFQSVIDQLVGWCESNRLFFNIGKCKVMTFGRLRNPLMVDYTMSDTRLQRETEILDLGVHFDHKMSFVKHINVVVAKSYSMLYQADVLQHGLPVCPKKSLLRVCSIQARVCRHCLATALSDSFKSPRIDTETIRPVRSKKTRLDRPLHTSVLSRQVTFNQSREPCPQTFQQ